MSLTHTHQGLIGPAALSRGPLALIFGLTLVLHLTLVTLVFWVPAHNGTMAEGQGGLTLGLGPAGAAPGALSAVQSDNLEASTPATLPPVEAIPDAIEAASPDPMPEVSPEPMEATLQTLIPQSVPLPVMTQAPQYISETMQSPIISQSESPETAISETITATTPQDGLGVSRRPVKRPLSVEDAGRKAAEAKEAAQKQRRQREAAKTRYAAVTPSPSRKTADGKRGQSGSSQGRTRGGGDDTRGGGNAGARADFATLIAARLARAKRYPRAAQQRRLQGTGVVWFRINAAGTVTASRLTRSTGHPILDQEIMQTLRRARLPSIPAILNQTQIEFSVPMAFNLR